MERRLLGGWLGETTFGWNPVGGDAGDGYGVWREVWWLTAIPLILTWIHWEELASLVWTPFSFVAQWGDLRLIGQGGVGR